MWDQGILVDGGRCIGPTWWCRLQAPTGVVALAHGWTPKMAAYEAVSQLARRGFSLDTISRDAIVDGLKLQVFGR